MMEGIDLMGVLKQMKQYDKLPKENLSKRSRRSPGRREEPFLATTRKKKKHASERNPRVVSPSQGRRRSTSFGDNHRRRAIRIRYSLPLFSLVFTLCLVEVNLDFRCYQDLKIYPIMVILLHSFASINLVHAEPAKQKTPKKPRQHLKRHRSARPQVKNLRPPSKQHTRKNAVRRSLTDSKIWVKEGIQDPSISKSMTAFDALKSDDEEGEDSRIKIMYFILSHIFSVEMHAKRKEAGKAMKKISYFSVFRRWNLFSSFLDSSQIRGTVYCRIGTCHPCSSPTHDYRQLKFSTLGVS